MEALEYCTFQAMADPAGLLGNFHIHHLGESSEHLNYEKHSMVQSLYCFHVYYHVRQVLKRLQVLLLCISGFNATDNPYSNEEFLKVCEDYRVLHDPMRYWNESSLGPPAQGLVRLHRP